MNEPFIIDVHTHLGDTPEFRARFSTPAEIVSLMDATRTRISIFVTMGALSQQFELGYREAVEAIEQFPSRFRAYTIFDPNWPDLSMRYMEKYQSHPGFAGVKIHPARHETAPEDARYKDLWAFANEKRLVVLTHTWSLDPAKPAQNLSTPDRFASVLDTHKHLKLILGHAGGRESGMRQAMDLIKQYSNVWADLSGDYFALGRIEWMVDEVGASSLLYGTDQNWIEPRILLGHVLKSRISPEDRLRIFRDNALEVFGDKIR